MERLLDLAMFVGSLYRRYSCDITPVLKYIVHQLYNGQTTEIIVLEKLILKLAGIEPLPSLSDTQIVAMAGGPTLRTEAVASDLRGTSADSLDSQKGALRLGKALIDTGLAFPLLVQVEQQRQACVYRTNNAHLKSMAYLFDSVRDRLSRGMMYTDEVVISDAWGFVPVS
jgi:THO complex subunit 2